MAAVDQTADAASLDWKPASDARHSVWPLITRSKAGLGLYVPVPRFVLSDDKLRAAFPRSIEETTLERSVKS